jgi:hypothetical protein
VLHEIPGKKEIDDAGQKLYFRGELDDWKTEIKRQLISESMV